MGGIGYDKKNKKLSLLKKRTVGKQGRCPGTNIVEIPIKKHMSGRRPRKVKKNGKTKTMSKKWRNRGRVCKGAILIERCVKGTKDYKTGKFIGVRYRAKLSKFAIARYHKLYHASKVNVFQAKKKAARKKRKTITNQDDE